MVKKTKIGRSVPKNLTISAFFPCYNDAGTIASMVELATLTLKKFAREFEIIVVDDGSTDCSREILKELSKKNGYLKLIFHDKNRGYGGALISGFQNSKYEYVFYTDGDFQYDVSELPNLIKKISNKIDVVQGYKIKRHDPWFRILIGNIYNLGVKATFGIKIRDVDCDFRLIRRSVFEKVTLMRNSGVITVEMIKKLEDGGFKFVEVPVTHSNRTWGQSQFFNFNRIFRVATEILELWQELVLRKWRIIKFLRVKTS